MSASSGRPSVLSKTYSRFIDGLEIGYSNKQQQQQRRGIYATKNFNSKEKIICKIPSDIALALINAGANVNIWAGIHIPRVKYYYNYRDKIISKCSALMLAAKNNNIALVLELIKAGADVNVFNNVTDVSK